MGRRNARYTSLDVEGPLPLDMLRAVPLIRSAPLTFLRRCVERYGDLVAFPIPGRPVLLVNDTDGVRRVLLERPARFGKATVQYSSLAQVTGVGLLTAETDQWKPRRAIVQPGFHHTTFASVAAATGRIALDLRARLDAAPGGADVEAEVLQAMLDVVAATLFDTDLGRLAPLTPGEHLGRELVEAVDDALNLVIAQAQLPLPGPLSWLTRHRRIRLERAVGAIDAACERIVTDRRARGPVTGQDVLGLLLRAQDDGLLDARQVRDEMVTMVVAGHETVASALTWTLYLLARHPSVQDRVAAELDDVLGPAGVPSWDDVPRLRLTRAVFDESLRLYPPAWVITRTALEDDVVAGVDVPAGTLVIISPWLLHRREPTWTRPDRFDPTRFLPDGDRAPQTRRPSSSRPSVDYLPFGLGPRLCIGRELALVEGVMMLATVLHARQVLPTEATTGEVPVQAMITMRPRGGMPLRLVPR